MVCTETKIVSHVSMYEIKLYELVDNKFFFNIFIRITKEIAKVIFFRNETYNRNCILTGICLPNDVVSTIP